MSWLCLQQEITRIFLLLPAPQYGAGGAGYTAGMVRHLRVVPDKCVHVCLHPSDVATKEFLLHKDSTAASSKQKCILYEV